MTSGKCTRPFFSQQADSSTAVVNTLSYDNADQLVVAAAVPSGGTGTTNQYNYDPAGNRLAETTLSGTTVTGVTGGLFNNLNQLTTLGGSTTLTTVSGTTSLAASSVIVNGVNATVTGTAYSATIPTVTGTNVLNITAKPTSGAPVTQRFAITATGSATTTLTYDANGNTTTDEKGNTYKWDALNRLTKITYPDTSYSTFAYDGLSRRTQIAEYDSSHSLTSTKNYLWIGSEIAEERDASNNVTKKFFPQGEQQAGTNYYYTRDHERSVREMCDASGNIVSRLSYDPYGRTTLISGSNLATKQYAGMYMHEPSSLNFTRAGDGISTGRPYRSNLALFPTRDPLGETGGINLYDYVLNDPVDRADPFGLKWKVTNSSGTYKIYPCPKKGGKVMGRTVTKDPKPDGFILITGCDGRVELEEDQTQTFTRVGTNSGFNCCGNSPYSSPVVSTGIVDGDYHEWITTIDTHPKKPAPPPPPAQPPPSRM